MTDEEKMMEYANAIADQALAIVVEIKPLLAGKGMEVQSAVLCDMIAIFLAGLPNWARSAELAMLMTHASEMAAILEKQIHGPDGHPQNSPREETMQ